MTAQLFDTAKIGAALERAAIMHGKLESVGKQSNVGTRYAAKARAYLTAGQRDKARNMVQIARINAELALTNLMAVEAELNKGR